MGQLVLAQAKGDEQVMTFLGSCFACLSPHAFATAHHCISDLPTAENVCGNRDSSLPETSY